MPTPSTNQRVQPPPLQISNMSPTDRAAILSKLESQRADLCERILKTDILYLDLGLEYHALPLELRDWTPASNYQIDCRAAFVVQKDSEPDIVGYILDLRHLCTAVEHSLAQLDVAAAQAALKTMEELSSALENQMVAVKTCVDELHRRFSDMLDEGVEFEEGGLYRLALKEEDGLVKHKMLKAWMLALPRVQELLWRDDVADEYEAMMLAMTATATASGGGGGSFAAREAVSGRNRVVGVDYGGMRKNRRLNAGA